MTAATRFDFCVIGGGIVGLATARAILERHPDASLVLIEKEDRLAAHQTGRNSGVIHSGIYYAPGSLKATLCRQGCAETKSFCDTRGIPYEVCGKLLVATDAAESARMEALYRRSIDNGVEVEELGASDLARLEPNIAGVGALRIASSGIVDYGEICRALARELGDRGAQILTGQTVTSITETADGVLVRAGEAAIDATRLIACAGLQSDRLARLSGLDLDVRIVPFKGEYFKLLAGKSGLISHLIYPIPDPTLPFLGIHLTRMIDGSVTVGPNAVLALDREGYRKFDFNLRDAAEALGFDGFWRMIGQHWKATLNEGTNSVFRSGYLQQCRKYCPSLRLADLRPHPSGIRAQAVRRDGTLIHDFHFARSERMLHVMNAPSPAATAALPIGRLIAQELLD